MKNTNFIAIDFETATPQRAACQIGIVVVKKGRIVEKINRLIQPPNNKYSKNCINVHGITPEMTANSPTFDVVWEDIKEYFEGNFIVAHNASFDLNVLSKSLDTYGIVHPIFMGTECTYRLYGMSLDDACTDYDIPLCNHHDGLCDAEACALLFLKYLSGEMHDTETDIEEYIDIDTGDAGEYDNEYQSKYFNPFKHSLFLEECSINDPLEFVSDEDISTFEHIPFFDGKRFIITGGTIFDRNKAVNIITSLGGKKASNICKSIDYVIIGENPGPKKMEQLEELITNKVEVKTFTDSEFTNLLKSLIEPFLK